MIPPAVDWGLVYFICGYSFVLFGVVCTAMYIASRRRR